MFQITETVVVTVALQQLQQLQQPLLLKNQVVQETEMEMVEQLQLQNQVVQLQQKKDQLFHLLVKLQA